MSPDPTGARIPGAAVEPEVPERDPLIGQLLASRYRILSPLGRGGVGRVYEAQQEPLSRRVAIKIVRPWADADPTTARRFLLEASITARLNHPHTVTVFDYGQAEDGLLFLAMELLEGRTLSQLLQREGCLAPARAVHVAQQICRSLREAHSLGVIHRDLKPANIFLVDGREDADFVKVLDFGLVKVFGDGEIGLTQKELFLGTPHYIAPEQARNQSPDPRSDIYALGIVLFQMLAGRVPFEGTSAVDVVVQHISNPPPKLLEARPGLALPAGLQEVVSRCLEKDRVNRFQSMDELLAALRELAGPGAAISTHTGAYQLPSAAGSNPSLSTPQAMDITPMTAEAPTERSPRPATHPSLPASSTGGPAAPKAPGSRLPLIVGALLAGSAAAVFLVLGRPAPPVPSAQQAGQQTGSRQQTGAGQFPSATAEPPTPGGQPAPAPSPAPSPAGEPAPAAPPASARNVPDFVLRREAISQPAPKLSGPVLAALRANGRVVAVYRVCAGQDGSVVFASAVQGFALADAEVLAGLRAWTYKPQPIPLCAQVSVYLEAP